MIDFDKIKKLYKLTSNLSFSDVHVLITSAKFRALAPAEHLLKAGRFDSNVYFIREGLIRSYLLNDKGDEITTALNWEYQVYVNPEFLLFQQASRHYVQALEQTELLYMDFDDIQSLLAQNPKLAENRRHIARATMKRMVMHTESFILYSAEERYLNFVKNNPDIVNRVPGKYIANVLGITPVSLSRIRKRIAQKKAGTP